MENTKALLWIVAIVAVVAIIAMVATVGGTSASHNTAGAATAYTCTHCGEKFSVSPETTYQVCDNNLIKSCSKKCTCIKPR